MLRLFRAAPASTSRVSRYRPLSRLPRPAYLRERRSEPDMLTKVGRPRGDNAAESRRRYFISQFAALVTALHITIYLSWYYHFSPAFSCVHGPITRGRRR